MPVEKGYRFHEAWNDTHDMILAQISPVLLSSPVSLSFSFIIRENIIISSKMSISVHISKVNFKTSACLFNFN